MGNEDGSVWAVCNGEIYNHKALRSDLEKRGHRFQGHCDAEIVPHLYEEYGQAFVERLRGMFAIAIFDRNSSSVVLARDRFGIKPLFYAVNKRYAAFASEVSALLHFPAIDDEVDRQSLSDCAALMYVPAPRTFFRGISAVRPGELISIRVRGGVPAIRRTTYYAPTIAPDPALREYEAAQRAGQCLDDAVRSQLESDVPLGALLSGGIDSSLVSAAANEHRAIGIDTFNVRFASTDYDETSSALAVAESVGTRHRTIDMPASSGSWDFVVRALTRTGQPFADTSIFAVHAISQAMREHVKVALSGDGGDEAFGGYNAFWQVARINRLRVLPPPVWTVAAGLLEGLSGRVKGLVPASLPMRLRELKGADNTTVVESLMRWVGPEEHRSLVREIPAPVRRVFEPQWHHELPASSSRLEAVSAHLTETCLRVQMPNDYLFKVDNASMQYGLEVRVPMLDESLVGFGLTLPHQLKTHRRVGKTVLRALAAQRLPREIAVKPKQGFGVPVDTWVDAQFKRNLKASVLDRASPLEEFFFPSAYRDLVDAFCDGRELAGVSRAGLYQRVIMLLAVQLCLEERARIRAMRLSTGRMR